MLKNRIAVTAIALGLSVPGLSQASPASWVPGLDAMAQLTRVWDLLHGTRQAPRPARILRKSGCGMDPNGAPCGPTTPAGSNEVTSPSDGQ
jgi:hypothetical protein